MRRIVTSSGCRPQLDSREFSLLVSLLFPLLLLALPLTSEAMSVILADDALLCLEISLDPRLPELSNRLP
jgi:hypothetical protein